MLNDLAALIQRLQLQGGRPGSPVGGLGGMRPGGGGIRGGGGIGAISGQLFGGVDSGLRPTSIAPNVVSPGADINKNAILRRLNGSTVSASGKK